MTEKKEIEEIRDVLLNENVTLTQYEAYDLAIKIRNLNYQKDIRHHLRLIEEGIDSLDNSINRL